MRRWLRDPTLRGRLALAILGIVVLGLVLPFAMGGDARHLSAYGGGAEDLSDFRASLPPARTSALLATPAALNDVEKPAGSLYVAIGIERKYDAAEEAAILSFLERGGNVLIADEGGYANRIAHAAGFAFDTDRVLDSNGYLGKETLPVVRAGLAEGDASFKVVFNLPTKVTALSNAKLHEVLARSSPGEALNGSYVDNDGDGAIQQGDTPGPHPLIVRTRLGEGSGTLLLVADTGLFMNEQLRIPDLQYENTRYVQRLVESLLGRDGAIYLDESRHAPCPALAPMNNAMRTIGRATTGFMLPILVVGLAVLTFLGWYYTRETEDWSHHRFDLGKEIPAPADLRPDADRLQRLARRRISERYNIPAEQVAAMPAEELLARTGDRALAEAAAGTYKGDPAPLFATYSPPSSSSSPEVQ